MKQKLYIVFDQLPSSKSGGLIATYYNLVKLLENEYDINIVSIFKSNDENEKEFSQYSIHNISLVNIDIHYFRIVHYLVNDKDFIKFFKALFRHHDSSVNKNRTQAENCVFPGVRKGGRRGERQEESKQ